MFGQTDRCQQGFYTIYTKKKAFVLKIHKTSRPKRQRHKSEVPNAATNAAPRLNTVKEPTPVILRPQPLTSRSDTVGLVPGGGLVLLMVLGPGVGAGVLVEVGPPLGTAVGEVVNVSTPDGVLVCVPDGAGVLTLLLLPLVAVVPQPQTTKNWSSSTISSAPLPSTSPDH